MQKDLVVAYQQSNLEKVYSYQYKIITSFAGRAIAIRRVTTSKGKNTPGVDKII
jgi:RNA-directed DNA polymerase